MAFSINKSKKVLTINNAKSYKHINIIENNTDKISNLVITTNNKLLYEKENEINKINVIEDNQNIKFEKNCYICEKFYTFPNLYFAKCKIHLFCKNCLKIYCHNLITKGIKKIKCPIYNCNCEFEESTLKIIVDDDCYNVLFRNNNELKNIDKKAILVDISKPLISIDKDALDKIGLYNKENVLDVNTNLTLYSVRKSKDEYCPNCHEHSLFIKANAFFNKCLNCGHKICRYCNKEFTNIHFALNDPGHCKVYFRRKKNILPKNIFFKFIFQLIYIIGMYIISINFCFLIINNFFLLVIGIRKGNKNSIKIFILYFLSFLSYLIVLPFLVIFIPFFPSIVALTDGY